MKTVFNPSKEVFNLIEAEYNKCIGCKKCMSKCPMLKEHCDNPKELLKDLLESKTAINSYFGDLAALRMPFTCTLCSFCDQVCPKDVELSKVFYSLKKDVVNQIGYPKAFGKTVLGTHQTLSFSAPFSTKVKTQKSVHSNKDLQHRMVFYPGCSPSAHSPNIMKKVHDYMNEHVDTVLYKKCCGNPTLSVGLTDKFNAYTGSVIKDINALKADTIVVLCMNCYNTLQNLFPSLKVITLWEFMQIYGTPSISEGVHEQAPVFSLHDPCPTRKHEHIHNAVRHVLNQFKIKYEEFAYNKSNTVCCGSGGMLSVIHPNLAEAHKHQRASEASTDHILTYCQECTESLKLGGKKTLHVLDLIFEEYVHPSYDQTTQSTLKKWLNRHHLKRESDLRLLK